MHYYNVTIMHFVWDTTLFVYRIFCNSHIYYNNSLCGTIRDRYVCGCKVENCSDTLLFLFSNLYKEIDDVFTCNFFVASVNIPFLCQRYRSPSYIHPITLRIICAINQNGHSAHKIHCLSILFNGSYLPYFKSETGVCTLILPICVLWSIDAKECYMANRA